MTLVTDPAITTLAAINPVCYATIPTTKALASYATTSVTTILASYVTISIATIATDTQPHCWIRSVANGGIVITIVTIVSWGGLV